MKCALLSDRLVGFQLMIWIFRYMLIDVAFEQIVLPSTSPTFVQGVNVQQFVLNYLIFMFQSVNLLDEPIDFCLVITNLCFKKLALTYHAYQIFLFTLRQIFSFFQLTHWKYVFFLKFNHFAVGADISLNLNILHFVKFMSEVETGEELKHFRNPRRYFARICVFEKKLHLFFGFSQPSLTRGWHTIFIEKIFLNVEKRFERVHNSLMKISKHFLIFHNICLFVVQQFLNKLGSTLTYAKNSWSSSSLGDSSSPYR